jgi:hypothetical protein
MPISGGGNLKTSMRLVPKTSFPVGLNAYTSQYVTVVGMKLYNAEGPEEIAIVIGPAVKRPLTLLVLPIVAVPVILLITGQLGSLFGAGAIGAPTYVNVCA